MRNIKDILQDEIPDKQISLGLSVQQNQMLKFMKDILR